MDLFHTAARFVAGGLCIAVAAFSSGCNQVESSAEAKSTSDLAPVVQVVTPTRTTITRVTTQPATVHAWHEAEIHGRVAGYLAELKVDIGDNVSRGDVLAQIDAPELKTASQKQEAVIRRLLAEVQRSQAAVKLAEADVQSSEAMASQTAADVGATVAELTAAKSEFDRVRDLVNSMSVAARLLDEAQQKYEAAAAKKSSAEAALASARAAVVVSRERAAVARASMTAAQAEAEVARKTLEEQNIMLGYATLTAPFDGVVTARNVDPGDLVRKTDAAGSGAKHSLFSVAQVDQVRVQIALPENEAAIANVGDAVSLRVRALPGQTFNAKINRIARRLDESTRTMLAEVDLPNEDGLLLPGMYAEATITLQETPNSLALAATAVRFDEAGNSTVCIIDGNSKVKVVAVATGFDDGKQIEILGGLEDTARVAAGQLEKLEDGQKVRVK
ncbi:MAG: efflux RND transporter periplasmic adaptor subunit [Planctomycetota bacterium]|jgi:RND family efflux transporter MFP subunit